MPVSVHQTAWSHDLERYHRDGLASRPVPHKFLSVVAQGHGVSPPRRGEAVPPCCGSHVCTASGATKRNGSQFVCIKQLNQLNVTVLLTVWIPAWNKPTPTTPPKTALKIHPQIKWFLYGLFALQFNSIQFRKTLLQNATQ